MHQMQLTSMVRVYKKQSGLDMVCEWRNRCIIDVYKRQSGLDVVCEAAEVYEICV